MQKSFTAALLCAVTFAVKINDEVKSVDVEVEEQFNVQSLDWSDKCLLEWSRDDIEAQFEKIDNDGNGTLDKEEVKQWLKSKATTKAGRTFFKHSATRALQLNDTDASRSLTLKEWFRMWDCKLGQPKILWTF